MSKDQISSFCNELSSFCNNLQSSTNALKLSIDRRPIPLDSTSSTFIQSLNRRVSTATSDLEMLESMYGIISFQELLGHCNELYKINQTDMLQIEDHLKTYHGYVPDVFSKIQFMLCFFSFCLVIFCSNFDCNLFRVLDLASDVDEEDEVYDMQPQVSNYKLDSPSLPMADFGFKNYEDDDLLDESMSLKQLGLSDACLATLASEDNAPSPELEK